MIEALQRDRIGQRLVETLAVAGARDYWPGTLESMWTLLSRLGTRDDWQGIALDALRTIDRGGNHHFDTAVERLATASDDQRRSITTLPTE
jgi:hypothetical protein